jgi:hypothetical protein
MSEVHVYGEFQTKERVRQRYYKKIRKRVLKRRKDGVKQHYWINVRQRFWKVTKRTKKVVREGRFNFSGKGRDLWEAVRAAKHHVPKGKRGAKRVYIDAPAKEFLENPDKFSEEGDWIWWKIES